MPPEFLNYKLTPHGPATLTISAGAGAGNSGTIMVAKLLQLTEAPDDINPVIAPVPGSHLAEFTWNLPSLTDAYHLMVVATTGGGGPASLSYDVVVKQAGQTAPLSSGKLPVKSYAKMGENYRFPGAILNLGAG